MSTKDTDPTAVENAGLHPGITLRKLASGEYIWEIHVSAVGSSTVETFAALDVIGEIDAELSTRYGGSTEIRGMSPRTQRRTPNAEWAKEPATDKQLVFITDLCEQLGLELPETPTKLAAWWALQELQALKDRNAEAMS